MCWFQIDPTTGSVTASLGDNPTSADPNQTYINDLDTEGFHDVMWNLQELIAPYPRPALEVIQRYIIDCEIPTSLGELEVVCQRLEEILEEIRQQWAITDEEYHNVFGRPATQTERFWIVKRYTSRLAVGLAQFTSGKTVVKEVWYRHDMESRWARLHVYQDGSADIWEKGNLSGFAEEKSARHEWHCRLCPKDLRHAAFSNWDRRSALGLIINAINFGRRLFSRGSVRPGRCPT